MILPWFWPPFDSGGSGGPFVPISRVLTAGLGLAGGGDLSIDRTFLVGANPDGSIVVGPDDIAVGILASDAQHGIRGGGTQHADATTILSGFMSAADKESLDVQPSGLRVFASRRVSGINTILSVMDTAYWVYLGRMDAQLVINFVRARVVVGGTGAQTAEIALASTPLAPNGASQTLTKIAANGTLDVLTAAGLKANTVALGAVVAAGTHLWGGIRTAMAGTEPTFSSLERDMTRGELMSTVAAGALTGAGPWIGTPLVDAAGECVEVRATID